MRTKARMCVMWLTLSGAGLLALALCCAFACAGQHVRPRRATQGDATSSNDQTSTNQTNATVINVRAGDDLQAALDRAHAGDTIMLAAGATFRGAFRLPNKTGADFITIRSAAADAQLPAPGERLKIGRASCRERVEPAEE